MVPEPPRKPHEKAAYFDGWTAAGLGAKRHERPNYPSHGEREAFGKGWDDRIARIAYGYYDDADCERIYKNA